MTMIRPSIDDVMMWTAQTWALRGTCSRLQVGAVAAVDGRVIASGYNGTIAGAAHCDHTCDCTGFPVPSPDPRYHYNGCRSQTSCEESVHAEANVIAFAARHGVTLKGATLYTTHAPCVSCARLIVNAGILSVHYASEYRSEKGLRLLRDNGVEVL